MTEPLPEIPAPRPSARLLAGLSACVLVIAVVGYAWKGSPGLQPVPAAAAEEHADADEQAAQRQQIEAMVAKLAQRLKDKPEDANGWRMLGRSYSVLGRVDDALLAYEKAVALRPNDAMTLADYADSLAMKNGGNATPQSDAIVARALAAEPMNLKALALAGTSAFERADYATAVRFWEDMARGLPPDSPDAPRLAAGLAEARKRGGLVTPTTSATASSGAPATAGQTMLAGSVSGTVTLSPALLAKASPTDTVFVFARAAQGPRMPLAVLRAQVKDLPLSYQLDDSMAMAPNAKISGAAQVVVGARISKSGNAIPQPGDLAGESTPVAPGARGVAITIGAAIGS
jgi:cytochrome c-type biogenesis protein CcmH